MDKAQRERKLNITADAIFSNGITDDEYERIKEQANYRPCAWCGKTFRWTLQFFPGPKTNNGNDKYCDPRCVEQAERKHAPLNNLQATDGTIVDGWLV
jgi:hypothetical protein